MLLWFFVFQKMLLFGGKTCLKQTPVECKYFSFKEFQEPDFSELQKAIPQSSLLVKLGIAHSTSSFASHVAGAVKSRVPLKKPPQRRFLRSHRLPSLHRIFTACPRLGMMEIER